MPQGCYCGRGFKNFSFHPESQVGQVVVRVHHAH